MLSVIVGLSGSLLFGSGDFFGGLASKKMGALLATGIAGLTGLILLFTLTFVVPGNITERTIFFGLLSGLVGGVAILLIYASLAIGPMSILSPLGALITAIMPVLWAIVIVGESVGWLGYVGFVIGSVAIVLVAIVKETKAVKPSFRGIFLATCAGILNGLYLVIIDQLPNDAGLYPLVFNRMVNISIMFSVLVIALVILKVRNGSTLSQVGPARFDILVGDRGAHNYRAGIKLALICGVLDSTGNALLLYGVQIGELSTISILTALYPAGTIILAAIILKERITKLQFTGMVLAIVAAALLAVS